MKIQGGTPHCIFICHPHYSLNQAIIPRKTTVPISLSTGWSEPLSSLLACRLLRLGFKKKLYTHKSNCLLVGKVVRMVPANLVPAKKIDVENAYILFMEFVTNKRRIIFWQFRCRKRWVCVCVPCALCGTPDHFNLIVLRAMDSLTRSCVCGCISKQTQTLEDYLGFVSLFAYFVSNVQRAIVALSLGVGLA